MNVFPKLPYYPEQTDSPEETSTGTMNAWGHHTRAEEAYVLR